MADGTLAGPGAQPADDSAVAGPGPGPTFIDRLWGKVLQAKKMGFSPADVDAYVAEHTNGRLKSVVDLTRAQAVGARATAGMEASKGPGAVPTFFEALSNQAGLGLPSKLNLPGVNPMLEAGAAEHPKTSVAGEMTGIAGPSALSGMLAERTLVPLLYKYLPGLSKLLPGIMRAGVRGAVGGAAGSGTSAYAASPDLTPNPEDIGKAAALGAAVGGPLGAAGGWAATKLEPAEVIARKAVARSTPEDVPGYGIGKGALNEGQTTPARVGPPDKNTIFQPRPETEYQKLPDELRPFNAEKSPELRNAASKEITKSPQAAASAENLMRQRMSQLTKAKQAISANSETGYKGLLQNVPLTDEQIAQLPADAQRAMNAKTSPTAYDLYGYHRTLAQKADAAFGMKAKGMEPKLDLDQAEAMGETASTIRQWLGDNVKGFNDLQAKVAPYLQRQNELRMFMRSIVGRAIKPLGKTSESPKGSLLNEGVKESYGYEPSQVEERASRALVRPFFSTKLKDLYDFVEKEPEFKTLVPAIGREAGSLVSGPLGTATQR